MYRNLVGAVRFVFGGLFVLAATAFFGLIVWLVGSFRPASPVIEWGIITWSRAFLWGLGVRLEIEGKWRVAPVGSYVYVSNHLSNFDIPVHLLATPTPIRYLAKKELFFMPIVGQAARAAGMVEVDRRRALAEIRHINEDLEAAVAAGNSLMIYPEGTRSRDGKLQPFKKGAFRIAIDHDLPVVPVAIQGTREAWPPGSKFIYGGKVRAVIHDPITTEGLKPKDADELMKRVRSIILESVSELERQS